MIFIEFRFLIFFLIVFCVYWILQHNFYRKLWLLGCSYIFYGAWDWRFLFLIFLSTAIDYGVGWQLSQTEQLQYRKSWLLLSLIANLGLLGFFKYYNFFAESAITFFDFLGIPININTFKIILPIGISFYTFQSLSYSIDIYRKHLAVTKNVVDFALYVSFFPQLVAGPIVRASDFLPQLRTIKQFDQVNVRNCLVLFLIGFFKKACVSDNLAPFIDTYFEQPEAYTALSSWFAVLAYAVQIYCDFSGYTDMAIASAELLGYQLCLNFAAPYFATNITDFWRRWHISLSTWLRDYLYIPLGGSLAGKFQTYRNLMITMLLGGLWHGAAWNFVLWGGLHGGALVVHRQWSCWVKDEVKTQKRYAILGLLLTFYWVCLTWIVFRTDSLPKALTILHAFVLGQAAGFQQIPMTAFLLLGGLAIAHWGHYRGWGRGWWQQLSPWQFALSYGLSFALLMPFIPPDYKPFIYFQF
ncbi:MBOAT family O-acyltransferase [Trichothermofontia sp.]